MNYFIHKPLDTTTDSFRLLELLPAEDPSDQIRCRMWHARLGDEPTYVALSYTWDSPILTHEPTRTVYHKILVNGETFEVRDNLHTCLRYLRLALKIRVLWIDAICIDQKNVLERNHQVSQMAKIYRSAGIVVAWLGEADEHTEEAAIRISKSAKTVYETGRLDYKPDVQTSAAPSGELDALASHEEALSDWSALQNLENRSWWTRLWTIQGQC
jgi:hypothetical protein